MQDVTATEVWMRLGALFHDNAAAWKHVVAEHTGMPFSRFRALRRLEDAPLSGRELADRLGVDAPACSVIVTDLAERGLVRKQGDPDDGRRKIITITPEGRALMDDLRSVPDAAPALASLTPEELATLNQLLTIVQEGRR